MKFLTICLIVHLALLTKYSNCQSPQLLTPLANNVNLKVEGFSPDGNYLITNGKDYFNNEGKLHVWDTRIGRITNFLSCGQGNKVISIIISSDSRYLTAVVELITNNAAIIRWELFNGKKVVEITTDIKGVKGFQVSDDQKYALVNYGEYNDYSCTAYDLEEKRNLLRLTGLRGFANLANKNLLVYRQDDKQLKLMNFVTGKIQYTLNSPETEEGYYLDKDSQKIFIYSIKNKVVQINDIVTGRQIGQLNQFEDVDEIELSPNNRYLVGYRGIGGKKLIVWNTSSPKPIYSINTGEVYGITFNKKGDKFIIKSPDARLVDAMDGKDILVLRENSGTSYFPEAHFINNEQEILGFTTDIQPLDSQLMVIWSIQSKKQKYKRYGINEVKQIPSGRQFLVDNEVWDSHFNYPLFRLEGYLEPLNFSMNGDIIATSSPSRPLRMLNVRNFSKFESWPSNIPIRDLYYDRSGRDIILEGEDSCIYQYNIASSEVINLGKLNCPIDNIFFSPDNKLFVSLSKGYLNMSIYGSDGRVYQSDKMVTVWNTEKKKKDSSYKLSMAVDFAEFNMSHNRLLTKDIKPGWGFNLINLSKRTLTRYNYGKRSPIVSCRFTDDGTKIIAAYSDSTIYHYSTLSREASNTFRINAKPFDISGKNKLIAALMPNSHLGLLDAATGKLTKEIAYNYLDASKVYFSEDEQSVVCFEYNNTITINTLAGKQVVLKGHNNTPRKLLYPQNMSFFVSSADDYTIRIWSDKGLLVVTIFCTPAGYLYLLPSGYYYGDKGASSYLGYSTDGQYIGFDQLDLKYNRPDKVLNAIGSSDTALIKSYYAAYIKRIKKMEIDTCFFSNESDIPHSEILNRESIDFNQKDSKLKLLIRGVDNNVYISSYNIWVNNVPIYGKKGKNIKDKNIHHFIDSLWVPLSIGSNKIEISITNSSGIESYRNFLFVKHNPPSRIPTKTYFIGIGIDHFKDGSFDLNYSVKDIRDLAKKLKVLYGAVIIDTLFNERVNRQAIGELKKKIMRMQVNDKIIIAYSGHGLLNKNFDYFLSTYDINFNRPEENGLPYEELENLLDSIPVRKKLMLLDACHSGEVDKDEFLILKQRADSLGLKRGIIIQSYDTSSRHVGIQNSFILMEELFQNVSRNTGATIISAAAGTQFALERDDLKNGVFTYCILSSLNQNPKIKISELRRKVTENVIKITNGAQRPTSRSGTIDNDWEL